MAGRRVGWVFARAFAWVAAVCCAAAGTPRQASAQELLSAGDGFLFQEPSLTLSLFGGYAHATAGSSIFAFTTQQLTLTRRSFDAPSVDGALGIRLSPRFDLLLDAAYAQSSAPSEFRNWTDQDSLPIQQTTTLIRLPLTVGVRAYLTSRGRSIGHFAWVPSTFAPYVGVAGGVMWYQFEQNGDFIDFSTLDVFTNDFVSSGWAPTAHVFAGADYSLSPRFAVTTEARYTWASASMSDSFVGFGKIDLSGYTASAGISFRY